MTPTPPDEANLPIDLPLGWHLAPEPIDVALMSRIRRLDRLVISFSAWLDMPPRHVRESESAWDVEPTPFARRHITGPGPDPDGRYHAILLTLHHKRRGAEDEAAARVIGEGQHVHRAIVGIDATALEIVDARPLGPDGLTNGMLLRRDPSAWQLLRAIRDDGAEAVWTANSLGSEQALVVFVDAIDDALLVREEAVHKFDASGVVEHLREIGTEAPVRRPRAAGFARPGRRWATHLVFAVLAVPIAHVLVPVVEALLGIGTALPASVIALLGFCAGFAVAGPAKRRMRALRRGLAHVIELPGSNHALVAEIDRLSRCNGRGTMRELPAVATTPPTSPARRRLAQLAVAVPCALAGPALLALAGLSSYLLLGLAIVAGLAFGVAVAEPLLRTIRSWRRVIVHILELPDTHAILTTRLDDLERSKRSNDDRPPGLE